MQERIAPADFGGAKEVILLRREEDELLRRFAATRSPRLRDELVRRFTPLARALASRFPHAREPLEDLVQVAYVGLIKAIDGFDPARGRPFTAYAVPTILGEIRRHFRDHVPRLRLPRRLQELTLAVEDAVDRLTETAGRAPTTGEIAQALGIEEEQVLEALEAAQARQTLSLDAPRSQDLDDAAPAVELVGDEDPGFDRVEAQLASEDAALDERERRVLRLRFEGDMTQSEVGDLLGVSQMQVSRIQRRALGKLLEAVRGGPRGGAGEPGYDPSDAGADPPLRDAARAGGDA